MDHKDRTRQKTHFSLPTILEEERCFVKQEFLTFFRSEKKSVILEYLRNCDDKEEHLIYYFTALNGMRTAICIEPQWVSYIHKNQEILKGWLQYNMIMYLQRRNPSVPGIADKLQPPMERKLDKVQKYWKLILEINPIREIYGDEIITEKNISIDHFVPWSYVEHDEFWNLHPTKREINSSKSNNLPDWDTYFSKLCRLEYLSYEMMNEHEVVQPVYQSAKNCGFTNWIYTVEG